MCIMVGLWLLIWLSLVVCGLRLVGWFSDMW